MEQNKPRPSRWIAHRKGCRESQRGFSLVETLAAMGLALALLGMLVPAFSGLADTQRRAAAARQLLALVEEARALAIAQGRATYVVFADESAERPFRAACIAQDDADLEKTPTVVTAWSFLPSGILLNHDPAVASVFTAVEKGEHPGFQVSGEGAPRAFPFIKFSPTGAVLFPSTARYARVVWRGEKASAAMEQVQLSMATGRPRYQLGE